jgi:hypothetical protein
LEYGVMIEMVWVTPPSQGKRYGRDEYPVRPRHLLLRQAGKIAQQTHQKTKK